MNSDKKMRGVKNSTDVALVQKLRTYLLYQTRHAGALIELEPLRVVPFRSGTYATRKPTRKAEH